MVVSGVFLFVFCVCMPAQDFHFTCARNPEAHGEQQHYGNGSGSSQYGDLREHLYLYQMCCVGAKRE